jgi:spectinomycin phosphotransferase
MRRNKLLDKIKSIMYKLFMKIDLEKISEIIQTEYEISVSSISQLNIGFDQNTTVFKLFSNEGRTFFLKIRSENFTKTSLTVPAFISDNINSPNIINIVKTTDRKLYVKRTPLYFMIFPFINGQSGWDISLTRDQFVDFGKFMHRMHSMKFPMEYTKMIPKERYDSNYRESVRRHLNNIDDNIYNNPVIIDFMNVFQGKKDIILRILDYLEGSVNEIKTKKQKMCLCHGDIHAGNILIGQNNFYIVDWDTIIIAPREKDLMFIGGGIGNKWNKPEEIEYFYYGYDKETEIDKNLIKYYRCERIIQDIYEFYNQIVNKGTEDEERKLRLKIFKEQFDADNVVDIALRT